MSMQINLQSGSPKPPEANANTNIADRTAANAIAKDATAKNRADLKKAATDFEAIMLSQMTSAMRPQKSDDEEGSLFGGEGDLTHQMFTEQLANAMSKAGGIGLADMLISRLDPGAKSTPPGPTKLERAASAAKELRNGSSAPGTTSSSAKSVAGIPTVLRSDASGTTVAVKLPEQPNALHSAGHIYNPARVPSEKPAIRPGVEWVAPQPVHTPAEAIYPVPGTTSTNYESSIDQLRQLTRPRRITELSTAPATSAASVIKIPTAVEAPAVRRVSAEAPSTPAPRRTTRSGSAPTASAPARASYTGKAHLDTIIEEAGARHGIDPNLVAAIIPVESGGRQHAVSKKGASGYMQIMPATFKNLAGADKDIFDPVHNINAGAAYLKYLSDKFDGSLDKVLAGYNAGPHNVERFGGVPPFRQTRRFVADVKRRYNDLVAVNSNNPSAPSTKSEIASKSEAASGGMKDLNTASLNTSPLNKTSLNAAPSNTSTVKGTPLGVAPSNTASTKAPSLSAAPSNVASAKTIPFKADSSRASVRPTSWKTEYAKSPAVRLERVNRANTSHAISTANFQLPVQGRISSPFGAPRSHHRHGGIDIAVPQGTPIEASADGTVVFAGWTRGYGKTVLIKHDDGLYTRYAHADHINVSRGDSVSGGQQVATVGRTGTATGPHLHFEVIQNGRHYDPLRMATDDSGKNSRSSKTE